jgi:hypothetical protein
MLSLAGVLAVTLDRGGRAVRGAADGRVPVSGAAARVGECPIQLN